MDAPECITETGFSRLASKSQGSTSKPFSVTLGKVGSVVVTDTWYRSTNVVSGTIYDTVPVLDAVRISPVGSPAAFRFRIAATGEKFVATWHQNKSTGDFRLTAL
jgi:hypothetical protein